MFFCVLVAGVSVLSDVVLRSDKLSLWRHHLIASLFHKHIFGNAPRSSHLCVAGRLPRDSSCVGGPWQESAPKLREHTPGVDSSVRVPVDTRVRSTAEPSRQGGGTQRWIGPLDSRDWCRVKEELLFRPSLRSFGKTPQQAQTATKFPFWCHFSCGNFRLLYCGWSLRVSTVQLF